MAYESAMVDESCFSKREKLSVIRYTFMVLVAIFAFAFTSERTFADSVSSRHAGASATYPPRGHWQARLETSNDRFELVARLHSKKLLVYVDHFATNEPLLNATVEVRRGNVRAAGTFDPDKKEYEIADPAFLAALSVAGKHKLDFTINGTDTLSGNMSIMPDDKESALFWLVILSVGIIILLCVDRAAGRRLAQEVPSSREDRQTMGYRGLCMVGLAAILTASVFPSHASAGPKLPSPDLATASAFKSEGLARLSNGTVNIPKQLQRRLGIQTLVVSGTFPDSDPWQAARTGPAMAAGGQLPNVFTVPAKEAPLGRNTRHEKVRTKLPAESVVRDLQGLPIIWIKISAERFAGAGVKLHGYRDGKAVVEGVPPNSRVVTSGADLINQIR